VANTTIVIEETAKQMWDHLSLGILNRSLNEMGISLSFPIIHLCLCFLSSKKWPTKT